MFHIYLFIFKLNILSSIFNIFQFLSQSIFLHHTNIYHQLVQYHYHKPHKPKNHFNKICNHQYMVHIYLLILLNNNILLNTYYKSNYHLPLNIFYNPCHIYSIQILLNNNFPNMLNIQLIFHKQHSSLFYYIHELFFYQHSIQAQLECNLNHHILYNCQDIYNISSMSPGYNQFYK